MGVQLYLSFDPPTPEAEMPMNEFTTDGSLLLNEIYVVDKIAEEMNLLPLASFMDNRQPPDDFSGDPDDFDRVMGPCDQWYSIEDALTSMDTIANLIKNDAAISRQFDNPEEVRSDIEEIASFLRIALPSGARFRFDVG